MPILTLDDLYAANINEDVAKEAYAQVEKRLTDLLETKKSFETRAASMLTAFITLALALTGAGASMFTSHLMDTAPKTLPWAFFVPALPLMWAAWTVLEVLIPSHYGNLGTHPDIWLEQGVIDANYNAAPNMQAYMVHHMRVRIAVTEAANDRKAEDIRSATRWATAAPVLLGVGFLVLWWWH
jgi:hypothetical protein